VNNTWVGIVKNELKWVEMISHQFNLLYIVVLDVVT
jgi:hypothetical protein